MNPRRQCESVIVVSSPPPPALASSAPPSVWPPNSARGSCDSVADPAADPSGCGGPFAASGPAESVDVRERLPARAPPENRTGVIQGANKKVQVILKPSHPPPLHLTEVGAAQSQLPFVRGHFPRHVALPRGAGTARATQSRSARGRRLQRHSGRRRRPSGRTGLLFGCSARPTTRQAFTQRMHRAPSFARVHVALQTTLTRYEASRSAVSS